MWCLLCRSHPLPTSSFIVFVNAARNIMHDLCGAFKTTFQIADIIFHFLRVVELTVKPTWLRGGREMHSSGAGDFTNRAFTFHPETREIICCVATDDTLCTFCLIRSFQFLLSHSHLGLCDATNSTQARVHTQSVFTLTVRFMLILALSRNQIFPLYSMIKEQCVVCHLELMSAGCLLIQKSLYSPPSPWLKLTLKKKKEEEERKRMSCCQSAALQAVFLRCFRVSTRSHPILGCTVRCRDHLLQGKAARASAQVVLSLPLHANGIIVI